MVFVRSFSVNRIVTTMHFTFYLQVNVKSANTNVHESCWVLNHHTAACSLHRERWGHQWFQKNNTVWLLKLSCTLSLSCHNRPHFIRSISEVKYGRQIACREMPFKATALEGRLRAGGLVNEGMRKSPDEHVSVYHLFIWRLLIWSHFIRQWIFTSFTRTRVYV